MTEPILNEISFLIWLRRSCGLEQQLEEDLMPPKVRELIAELERAGFVNRGGREGVKEVIGTLSIPRF